MKNERTNLNTMSLYIKYIPYGVADFKKVDGKFAFSVPERSEMTRDGKELTGDEIAKAFATEMRETVVNSMIEDGYPKELLDTLVEETPRMLYKIRKGEYWTLQNAADKMFRNTSKEDQDTSVTNVDINDLQID